MSKRESYTFNEGSVVTVSVPGVTDLNMVQSFKGEDSAPIGFRYLPKSARRPYFTDSTATGKVIGDSLKDRILNAGTVIDGTEVPFILSGTEEGSVGAPSKWELYRAVREDADSNTRTVVTVRERVVSVGGEMTAVPGEWTLNAWQNVMGERTGGGRKAVEATDSADDL